MKIKIGDISSVVFIIIYTKSLYLHLSLKFSITIILYDNIINMNPIRPNYYDILKVTAIVFMIIDHIWYFFFPHFMILRIIGRISMPIFLFLVGYNSSHHIHRSLILSRIIVEFSLFSYNHYYHTEYVISILWSIIIIKWIHRFYHHYQYKADKKIKLALLFTIIVLLSNQILAQYLDYWWSAIAIGLCGLLTRLSLTDTTSRRYIYLTYVFVWIFYCIQQIITFWIYGWYHLLLFTGLMIMSIVLLSWLPYKITHYEWYRRSKSILWISKHSLEIYMIHIILFICILYVLS